MSPFPVVVSVHTTYTLLFPDTAICGCVELPVLLLNLLTLLKLVPLSSLALKYMSPFPVVLSVHTTYTLLIPDVAMRGSADLPGSLLKFIVSPKLVPLSSLALKYMSPFPVVVSVHTTYTLLFPDMATLASDDNPALLLRVLVTSKLVPLSSLALKY